MKKLVTLAFTALVAMNVGFAQEKCGIRQATDVYFDSNPGAQQAQMEARERSLAHFWENGAQNPNRGGAIQIPVVFHVVYNTTAENISDALIMAQLNRLNLDFSTSYQSTQVSQFLNVAGNPNIQFCLADTDPQGNPTTGINRTQTSVTSFAIGHDMKSTTTGGVNPWPFGSYCNIWICDIGFNPQTGGTAGYAMLPGLGAGWQAIDGIVLAYQVVSGNETTLSHEMGHYLGLNHTWGDNESCANDDGFTDTPNCDGPNFFCPLTTQSCNSLDNVENFMDYADCPTMFTNQQIAFMNQILNTNYNPSQGIVGRASLQNSSGCSSLPSGQAPVAAFTASPNPAQVGQTVSFTNQSTNSPTSYSWAFGDGGTSTDTNPTHSYAAPGTYPVMLTATNSFGSSNAQVNVIVQQGGGGGTTTCDTLLFIDGELITVINPADEATFNAYLYDVDQLTINSALSDVGFTSGWDLVEDNGNVFLAATSWFETTNQATNLIGLGPLTIPNGGGTIRWKHMMPDNDYRDGYAVILNTTGNTVTDYLNSVLLWGVNDNDPSTDGHDTQFWPQSVAIPAQYSGMQVNIGFLHDATDMFFLYLDDIYVEGCTSIAVAVTEPAPNSLFVYPNPATDRFTVMLADNHALENLTIVNAMGQTVWTTSLNGNSPIRLEADLSQHASGVYTLVATGQGTRTARRLVLQR